MRTFFIISAIIFSFLKSGAQSQDEIAIRAVLDKQVTAWNAGNIENFMQGYWRNDSLMFVGKSGNTYGWQQSLNNYKNHYPDTVAMGKLTFNLLEFKPLLPVYYFVVGKWQLGRSIGNMEGYFTLLFRKINGHWLIVVDHTS
jgi:ketosteroid isomerase-like protein